MSIKIKASWTDNNVIIEGVRIYKSSASFDVNSRPAVYAEILDGSDFYEDFDVTEGQTYFYMLSCFLGEQEVFTKCYEQRTSNNPVDISFIRAATTPSRLSTAANPWPLIIPAHNKGDIILVIKFGSDNDLAAHGFTQVSTTSLTNNFQRLWHKIAQEDQVSQIEIPGTQYSDKFAIVLRPSSPISTVDFSLSASSIEFTGNGDNDTPKSFTSPATPFTASKGYFIQSMQIAANYPGDGKAQTVGTTNKTLLLSPKTPTVYTYATVSGATDTAKAFSFAAFGEVSDGIKTLFGSSNSTLTRFPNSTGNILRFLNILVVAK